MVSPATSRVPARRAVQLAATQQLPPRSGSWGREATALLAAGIGGFGAAPLLHHPALAVPALGVGAAAGAARAVLGVRAQTRRQLADRLAEALAPALGLRAPNRRAVQLRGWSSGWPGVPRRVDLRYAPGVDDTDPGWRAELVAAVGRRLLADYQVARHDRRRCRLRLTWRPPVAAGGPPPAVQVRAERTVTELLGPTAVVTGVRWSEQDLTGLDVRHQAGAKLAASGYRHRVERVVSTMLPGRWRARWDLEADTVTFEVRPAFPASVWLPEEPVDPDQDLLTGYDELRIAYGVDEDGEVMHWRPPQDPHVMLVGTTGSGKTVCAHTLLVQATRRGWPVWVVDGKSVEFLGFQDWPNVQIVATSIEQQIAVITRAWEVMEHRYQLVTSGRAREADFEPLLVFLDEFADFRGNLLAWYTEIKVKGDPTAPPVLSRVASLARKGRTSRVHLIFGTQRPDATYFGTGSGGQSGDMRDNFRMRISLGRLSPQGALMMWESPAIGTSVPRGCRGRATTINEANRPVEIQTYRTPDPRKVAAGSAEEQLLERLRPPVVRHERLLILPPELDSDLDSGELAEPTYSDFAAARWVFASQRPDLDPVLHRQEEGPDGRELSSPMAVFGLRAVEDLPVDGTNPSAQPDGTAGEHLTVPLPRLTVVPNLDREDPDDGADPAGPDGYGPPAHLPVAELQVGDLVLVDQDNGEWGVVDQEVEPDLADPGCLAVSWRSDDDDCGLLSVPDDQLLPARRPLELTAQP